MNISDVITKVILNTLENAGGSVQIQRNELANQIGCVPSQINYVITSRFTPEQGYIVVEDISKSLKSNLLPKLLSCI